MTDYGAVQSDWWALLNWHLKINGTRPRGNPQTSGDVWTDEEFARACNVGDPQKPREAARTVQYWLNRDDGIIRRDITAIERALFGNNPEYAKWRRDLRVAHENAPKRKGATRIRRLATAELPASRADVKLSPELRNRAVTEGLLIGWRGELFFNPQFMHRFSEVCEDPEFIREVIMSHIPAGVFRSDPPSAVNDLVHRIVMPALRAKEWPGHDLGELIPEVGRYLCAALERKAYELGFYNDDQYRLSRFDREISWDIAANFEGLLPDTPYIDDICEAMYKAWRDVVTVAIENTPNEDKRYIGILSLYLYAATCDDRAKHYLVNSRYPPLWVRRPKTVSGP